MKQLGAGGAPRRGSRVAGSLLVLAFAAGCSGGGGQASADDAPDTTGTEPSSSTAPDDSATTGVTPVPSGTNDGVSSEPDADTSDDGQATTGDDTELPDPVVTSGEPTAVDDAWLKGNTLSLRSDLPLPYQGQALAADVLATQLAGYDPGSLLRCAVADDATYRAAIDSLGGVTWGYGVNLLEDQSKPRLLAGYQLPVPVAAPGAQEDGSGVEIEKPDVVAVTESAALFYSNAHGLLLVDLQGETPTFKCATQLPGFASEFFFHDGHLVAMVRGLSGSESALMHFKVTGSELTFVEKVSLGNVSIFDSRRFNDKLVFYTDLHTEAPPADPGSSGAAAPAPSADPWYGPETKNRALHVYRLGETLEREMFDTLIDTSQSEEQLFGSVDRDTELGSLIYESRWFGYNIWASDHYFVVTEQVNKTFLDSWRTDTYNICTQSHTVEYPYQRCWTEYETRPNPDYVEPDNSGGDRSCSGTTLSDCLIQVARVANKTIEVPVGQKCEEAIDTRWYCDAYEQRTVEYPIYHNEDSTRIYIYEYTEDGFVKVDTQVHEIAAGLEDADPNAPVESVTTSTETFDLAVPGYVQTLYFQNGYLYVISQGVLQVYAMGGSSIVRTSTLSVVNDVLQSSLFTDEQLFLSDFGYQSGSGDFSTLKVVDLSNPAFPKVEGSTHQLPGGHSSILAVDEGIFTIGSVSEFQGQALNALKLGLFSNPYADETAYLILGTDLSGAWLGTPESFTFDGREQRLALPYYGQRLLENQQYEIEYRVGMSHIEPGTIVSEGAVVVPEMVERVRRHPAEAASYLSFASSSIEWLTPADDEWQTQPVLEYLLPSSVYRLNEDNDYVEFQRLGKRCRLYFANSSDINQRETGTYSDEFTCSGWPTAYANKLVMQSGSVEFGADHSIRLLSEDEVAELQTLISERPVCVLSEELVANTYVDPNALPENAEVTCMSPEVYRQRSEELLSSP